MTRLVSKKAAVDDARKLSGPEKAAVVLLSLGEEHTVLWQQLDDEEIKEVSQAMAGLGTLVLSGDNRYSGDTKLLSGVLQADAASPASALSMTRAES